MWHLLINVIILLCIIFSRTFAIFEIRDIGLLLLPMCYSFDLCKGITSADFKASGQMALSIQRLKMWVEGFTKSSTQIRMSYGDLNYLGSNKAIFYFDIGIRGKQIFNNSMYPLEQQPKYKDIISH